MLFLRRLNFKCLTPPIHHPPSISPLKLLEPTRIQQHRPQSNTTKMGILPPKFAAHRRIFTDTKSPEASAPPDVPDAPHTIEVFFDYTCPYAGKLFTTLTTSVIPSIQSHPTLAPKLQLVFRHLVQPWHPSSTMTHEAALAVLRLDPDRFWDFSTELFRVQRGFFDVGVAKETRNETNARLAQVAGAVGIDEKAVMTLLTVPEETPEGGSDNGGNELTKDIKQVVRIGRDMKIHMSPTVVFDGVVQEHLDSSSTGNMWMDWLEKNVP